MFEAAIPKPQHPVQPRLQALVTGFGDRNLVEFTFIYGDPDLSVELVLPFPAFREFCIENGCEIAAGDAHVRTRVEGLLGTSPPILSLAANETEPRS